MNTGEQDDEGSGLSPIERWVVRRRTASALLFLAVVGSPYIVRCGVSCVARIDAANAEELRQLHIKHDEWVRHHSGELRSVCHPAGGKCNCDSICDHNLRDEACTAERLEVAANGDVLCKVP